MSFETADTEETPTCLHITVYHPRQEEMQVFRDLRFSQRQKMKAEDVVKFGRDRDVCHFNLVDSRVSRSQFALQLFRLYNSSEFGFEIKNLSRRMTLIVNNVELPYLNKVDLPENCIVGFGDYQFRMEKQAGQSEDYFDIRFELATASLFLNQNLYLHQPVPESGSLHSESPIEVDENE